MWFIICNKFRNNIFYHFPTLINFSSFFHHSLLFYDILYKISTKIFLFKIKELQFEKNVVFQNLPYFSFGSTYLYNI